MFGNSQYVTIKLVLTSRSRKYSVERGKMIASAVDRIRWLRITNTYPSDELTKRGKVTSLQVYLLLDEAPK